MKKFVALAVLSLVVAVGCTPEPDDAPSPTPTVSSSPTVEPTPSESPSPSPTPAPSPSPSVFESFPPADADLDEENQPILRGLQAYYKAYEKFAGDPTLTDLTETQVATTGESSNVIVAEIRALRENGHIAVGERSFHNVIISDPSTTSAGVQTAEISYCNDRSRVRVLDAESKQDTGHRPEPFVQGTATLEQGTDGEWRVSMIRNSPVNSC